MARQKNYAADFDGSMDPEKKAAEIGLNVVRPADDELFIDVDDGKKGLENVYKAIEIVNQNVGKNTVKNVSSTPSKSGIGLHVVIKMDRPLDPWMRVALQACFGSDRMRELLSSCHLLKGTLEKPTLFFEREKAMPNPDRDREARYAGYSSWSEMADALGLEN